MSEFYFADDMNRLMDLESIAWEDLRGKSVLITGATGLIGSLLSKALLWANDKKDLGITVIVFARNAEKVQMVFGEQADRPDFKLVLGSIETPIDYAGDVNYVFHCASVTTSKTMVEKPVETLKASVEGTFNLMEFAKAKQVDAFVYVSSMEMYGAFVDHEGDITEEDLGYVNPLNVRSNYPESKRLCENMCVAYLKEYGIPTRIARLAQTFGPGILPGENRVFAQFARSAMKGEDIVLHTKGLSEGNYCYSRDTVSGLLTIALKGADGEAYNVSNPATHTTIAAMAEMVAREFGNGACNVVFDIPETNTFGYAADTKMKLSSDKLQSLGWKPEVDLREAYERLIGSIA